MTVGKVTKKDSRLFSRTYKFMKKNTNNLTLKDFAELIDFMTEADESLNNPTSSQQETRQSSRPVLGLGHFLDQPSRINHALSAGAPGNVGNSYKRTGLPIPPEKKKEIDANRNPLEAPTSRPMETL
ncbi:uncharacterized protein [Epargyreus clarus]|uniref:uncharacterized protein n=1 Tax=Epargyreus clarus TaxID=520877 RepID=UPI003C2E7857